jgi:SAM-dependent methyltransferase
MDKAMNQAMKAEFDTVAGWTADVAVDLGPDFHLAAGCRGSGSPASLRWLIQRLDIGPGDRMLDCGAGVGGPAAFVAAEVGVRPVLSDPQPGACVAARRLFGLPVVQSGSELPFAADALDVIWSLGVVCTVADQGHLLRELHRVLTPTGRLGLLVFVARELPLSTQPSGNNFPTDAGLRDLLAGAGLQVQDSATIADFAASPTVWQERADEVEVELKRRHGADPTWQTAARQAQLIGSLLHSGELVGTLVVARPVS